MRQGSLLDAGEEVFWEGRPAPRCYTFRHWRHSIFGLIFLAISAYWQVLGISMAKEYEIVWLPWLPLPFVCMGIYLSVGHLIQARLEWNRVYYAITDRRLLVQRGLFQLRTEVLPLKEITYFSLHQQGEQLGTLRVYIGKEQRVVLHCIEHPRQATDLLEKTMSIDVRPIAPKTAE